MAKIDVSTRQVIDSRPELQVSVSASFEYDVPEVNDTQSAEQCLKLLIERHGSDEVYKLAKGQLIIALQAPSRKEVSELWDALPEVARSELIGTAHTSPEAKTVEVELPAPQQAILQDFMSAWKLGERTPRTRIVRMVEDPIDAIARKIASGEMPQEEIDAMRAKAMELLGFSQQQNRRR